MNCMKDRVDRLLALSRKGEALTNLIGALQRGKIEIRAVLRFSRRNALEVTLGTNSAGAAVSTIDTAIKHLIRERGNVRRALASSKLREPKRNARRRG